MTIIPTQLKMASVFHADVGILSDTETSSGFFIFQFQLKHDIHKYFECMALNCGVEQIVDTPKNCLVLHSFEPSATSNLWFEVYCVPGASFEKLV